MGISGLLPFVKDATTDVDLKQYSGKRIAVDASAWLHRGKGTFFIKMQLSISRMIFSSRDNKKRCKIIITKHAPASTPPSRFAGAYSCAVELIQNPAKADAYVGYAMRLAHMMRNRGTVPVLVFDGQ